MPAPATTTTNGRKTRPDYLKETAGDDIEFSTFDQILEMDEDEVEREFSSTIVKGFLEQAEETFQIIEENIPKADLKKLSSLGHFLKGSSATLGLIKLQASCEKIQHFGLGQDTDGSPLSDRLCLAKIQETLVAMKKDYNHVKGPLKEFFNLE